MNRHLTSLAIAGAIVCLGLGVQAEESAAPRVTSPLALSLVPALEFPSATSDVVGLRFGLFVSEHADVSMLDLNGLAGLSDGAQLGLQASGLYNRIDKAAGTLQISGLANDCRHDFVGGQVSALYNRVGGTAYGFSFAAVTSAETLSGFQAGLVNRVKGLAGLQIGLVNYADEAEGLQIGVINVMRDGKWPVLPILNWGE